MIKKKRHLVIITAIAAVIALVVTGCSTDVAGHGRSAAGPPAATSRSPIAPPTSKADEPRYITAVFNDIQNDWSTAFAASGQSYSPASLNIFTNDVQTGCGEESADTGPFYCPADSTVYLDLSFFDQLEQQYGARGAFAQAYVIAHEVGHHVQAISGTTGQVARLQAMNPTAANNLSVRTELQADCYAGVWAHSTYERGLIGPTQIDEAIAAAGAIGDDVQQQAALGRVYPQAWTHGSAEQRQHWLTTGYDTGSPASCNTFASLNQR